MKAGWLAGCGEKSNNNNNDNDKKMKKKISAKAKEKTRLQQPRHGAQIYTQIFTDTKCNSVTVEVL